MVPQEPTILSQYEIDNNPRVEPIPSHANQYAFDMPGFPHKQADEAEVIFSQLVSTQRSKNRKLLMDRETVEEWQLMSDSVRSQSKAAMFLPKSKVYENDDIKIGMSVFGEHHRKKSNVTQPPVSSASSLFLLYNQIYQEIK